MASPESRLCAVKEVQEYRLPGGALNLCGIVQTARIEGMFPLCDGAMSVEDTIRSVLALRARFDSEGRNGSFVELLRFRDDAHVERWYKAKAAASVSLIVVLRDGLPCRGLLLSSELKSNVT